MEPEIERVNNEYTVESEEPKVDVKVGKAGYQDSKLSLESSTEQWLVLGYRVSSFLDDLPSYVTYFFEAYKKPLIIAGLSLAALITVKLTLALLDALDDIPLLASLLEVIGSAYTIWFVYRYLISAASRQELSEEIKNLKEYVLGREN